MPAMFVFNKSNVRLVFFIKITYSLVVILHDVIRTKYFYTNIKAESKFQARIVDN